MNLLLFCRDSIRWYLDVTTTLYRCTNYFLRDSPTGWFRSCHQKRSLEVCYWHCYSMFFMNFSLLNKFHIFVYCFSGLTVFGREKKVFIKVPYFDSPTPGCKQRSNCTIFLHLHRRRDPAQNPRSLQESSRWICHFRTFFES